MIVDFKVSFNFANEKEKEKETQIDVVLLTFLNILSILRKCSTLP